MSKRPLARKVVIRFKGRDPQDPRKLLEAIEGALRPKDLEIIVETGDEKVEDSPVFDLADEQLETRACKHGGEVLEERARTAEDALRPPATEESTAASLSVKLGAWVVTKTALGWKIFVYLLPLAEKAAKIAESLNKMIGGAGQ